MNTLNTLFDWVLAASLRASIMVVAVIAAHWLFKHRLPSRWRYALWLPVLVALLVPALPLLPSWMNWPAAQSPAAAPVIPPGVTIVPHAAESAEGPELSRFANSGTVPGDTIATQAVERAAPALPNWRAWLMAAWLLGAAGLSLFVVTSLVLSLRRIRRHARTVDAGLLTQIARTAQVVGLRRVPRVLQSSAVASPAVCGLWRPSLLLHEQFPQDLSADEADMVLRHELTHIRRGDLATNALLCALLALHWFNPLLWLAFLRVRTDREAACDAQVLDGEPAARRAAYGHTLLKMETEFPPTGLCLGFVGILQRGGPLRERIHAIISQPKLNFTMKITIVLSIGVLTIAGIAKAAEDKPAKVADINAQDARLAGARKVSAAEFKKQYAWVGKPQSMHSISYLGRQDGKAFISDSSRSSLTGKWGETLIYTPLEDFDAEFRASLPAGTVKGKAGSNAGKAAPDRDGAAKPLPVDLEHIKDKISVKRGQEIEVKLTADGNRIIPVAPDNKKAAREVAVKVALTETTATPFPVEGDPTRPYLSISNGFEKPLHFRALTRLKGSTAFYEMEGTLEPVEPGDLSSVYCWESGSTVEEVILYQFTLIQ